MSCRLLPEAIAPLECQQPYAPSLSQDRLRLYLNILARFSQELIRIKIQLDGCARECATFFLAGCFPTVAPLPPRGTALTFRASLRHHYQGSHKECDMIRSSRQ